MSLNRDFKFTLTDYIEVTDHLLSLILVGETKVDEGVTVFLVGFLYINERVLTDSGLMENILIADVLYALEHTRHPLQVVLRQVGEERDGPKEPYATI